MEVGNLAFTFQLGGREIVKSPRKSENAGAGAGEKSGDMIPIPTWSQPRSCSQITENFNKNFKEKLTLTQKRALLSPFFGGGVLPSYALRGT